MRPTYLHDVHLVLDALQHAECVTGELLGATTAGQVHHRHVCRRGKEGLRRVLLRASLRTGGPRGGQRGDGGDEGDRLGLGLQEGLGDVVTNVSPRLRHDGQSRPLGGGARPRNAGNNDVGFTTGELDKRAVCTTQHFRSGVQMRILFALAFLACARGAAVLAPSNALMHDASVAEAIEAAAAGILDAVGSDSVLVVGVTLDQELADGTMSLRCRHGLATVPTKWDGGETYFGTASVGTARRLPSTAASSRDAGAAIEDVGHDATVVGRSATEQLWGGDATGATRKLTWEEK